MAEQRIRVFLGGQMVHESEGGRVRIGTDPECEVRLEDAGLEPQHGVLEDGQLGYVFRDLGSERGSFLVRGQLPVSLRDVVGRQIVVRDGDALLLGPPERPVRLELRIVAVERPDPREVPVPQGPRTERRISHVRPLDTVDELAETATEDQRFLSCLYTLLRRSAGVKSRERLLGILSDLVFEFFPIATHISVYARGEGDSYDPLFHRVRTGPSGTPPPPSRTLLRHVIGQREAILFSDAPIDLSKVASLVSQRIQSGICVPLWDHEGIRAVLQVDRRGFTGAFNHDDLDLLTLVGNHAAVLLANIEMIATLKDFNERLVNTLERVELLDRAKQHLSKYVPRAVRDRAESGPDIITETTRKSSAAVLFLDIAGYTKLTEALSHERVSWLIETYFSAFIDRIRENRGDINETAGDGLMVIFREQSAVENVQAAVRATLAIREATKRINREVADAEPIEVNMGVEAGIVTIGSRRIQGLVEQRWTYTATGMVTNLAARLANHARAGQILLGPGAAALLGDDLRLRDRGDVPFKNVARPVRIFEIVEI